MLRVLRRSLASPYASSLFEARALSPSVLSRAIPKIQASFLSTEPAAPNPNIDFILDQPASNIGKDKDFNNELYKAFKGKTPKKGSDGRNDNNDEEEEEDDEKDKNKKDDQNEDKDKKQDPDQEGEEDKKKDKEDGKKKKKKKSNDEEQEQEGTKTNFASASFWKRFSNPAAFHALFFLGSGALLILNYIRVLRIQEAIKADSTALPRPVSSRSQARSSSSRQSELIDDDEQTFAREDEYDERGHSSEDDLLQTEKYAGGLNGREISFIELKRLLPKKNIRYIRVAHGKNYGKAYLNNVSANNVVTFWLPAGSLVEKLETAQQDLGISPDEFIPIEFEEESSAGAVLASTLPLIISTGILIFAIRYFSRNVGGAGRGGSGGAGDMFKFGKSPHKIAVEKDLKVRFSDVAGLDEAKTEVLEFVNYLKNPEKFRRLGANIPKGALLVGPPGTGKTLLAKAIAGEAGVKFFSVSGSDFVEMFVGVGPSRVRDLFAQARAAAPCIVFIDEIDAIGRSRSKAFGNEERENTLNQLLVEMDGFQTKGDVIVFAGTNRADVLDSALLRPGRFDRHINVDLPDIKGRKQIVEVHLKNLKLADEPEYISKRLAALTPSMSGADIANLCNEAALIAARQSKKAVELIDFENAIDRVIGGIEKKSRTLGDRERRRVAYHEAGHAIAGWFLPNAYPLLKVSIVPRGVAALGYAQYQPRDQHLYTPDQFADQVCMTLGGRAAELIFFGNISTGARDDLQKVTNMIFGQLMRYGMNERIGPVAFPSESQNMEKPYSEETGRMIDEEARRIADECYQKVIQLLTEKKDLVERVALRLLEKEVLRREDMIEILGSRPFDEKTTYEEMLEQN